MPVPARHHVAQHVVHLEGEPGRAARMGRPDGKGGQGGCQRPQHPTHHADRGANQGGELRFGLVGGGEEPVQQLQHQLIGDGCQFGHLVGQRVGGDRLGRRAAKGGWRV